MLKLFAAALLLAASSVLAHAQTPNTIDCAGFEKLDSGIWRAKPDSQPFDLGDKVGVSIPGGFVGPGTVLYDYEKEYDAAGRFTKIINQRNPVDLYAALQAKCGP